MTSVNGSLRFSNVSTRQMSAIAKALDALSPSHAMYFSGCWSATRKGEVIATRIGWHQVFVPASTTERCQFFQALIDQELLYIKPENGVFTEIKVDFKEMGEK